MITTHTDARLYYVVFDDERTEPIDRYTIFYEGHESVVIAEPWEAQADSWQRVLREIANARQFVRRGAWPGQEYSYATVYAGVRPSAEQRNKHLRDMLSAVLYEMADPAKNKSAVLRVRALNMLSDLHELASPVRVRDFTLEEIEAEIARREAHLVRR